MPEIQQRIKYDSERVPSFSDEIMALPGCENLDQCIQCGTCSGICPMSIYMDHTPRRVINLTRAGFKKEVLESQTIWLCSSCYACTVECPRDIHITDVMYALKRRAMKEGVHPKRFPIPVLSEEFSKMVHAHGRTSESRLAMNMFLRTDWMAIFRMAALGINLMRTGRFSFRTERIEGQTELNRILDAAQAGNGEGAQ